MVRLSLENHAQDPDFRAGIAGGDLICSHGFGKRVPQGGRSGGPGCIVPYDLVSDGHLNIPSFRGGEDPDDISGMALHELIADHRLSQGISQSGGVRSPGP